MLDAMEIQPWHCSLRVLFFRRSFFFLLFIHMEKIFTQKWDIRNKRRAWSRVHHERKIQRQSCSNYQAYEQKNLPVDNSFCNTALEYVEMRDLNENDAHFNVTWRKAKSMNEEGQEIIAHGACNFCFFPLAFSEWLSSRIARETGIGDSNAIALNRNRLECGFFHSGVGGSMTQKTCCRRCQPN